MSEYLCLRNFNSFRKITSELCSSRTYWAAAAILRCIFKKEEKNSKKHLRNKQAHRCLGVTELVFVTTCIKFKIHTHFNVDLNSNRKKKKKKIVLLKVSILWKYPGSPGSLLINTLFLFITVDNGVLSQKCIPFNIWMHSSFNWPQFLAWNAETSELSPF